MNISYVQAYSTNNKLSNFNYNFDLRQGVNKRSLSCRYVQGDTVTPLQPDPLLLRHGRSLHHFEFSHTNLRKLTLTIQRRSVGPEIESHIPVEPRVTMKIKTHIASNKWNTPKRMDSIEGGVSIDDMPGRLEQLNVKRLARWCCYCRFVCNQKLFMHGCTTWWNNAQLPPLLHPPYQNANKKNKTPNENLMFCFETWAEFQISTPSPNDCHAI